PCTNTRPPASSSTIAAAVPTGRAPSSVSGRGGCAVITAIIHRPTVRLTSQYLLLSTRPGPSTRHTGKSADHSTELPTGHRLHVRSPDGRAALTGIFPAGGALRVNRIAASGTASAKTEARSAAGGQTAAPTDASAPRLRERQVELRCRRDIDLKHEITFRAADRLDGTPVLIAGAGGDLTVFDISSPAMPHIIGQATAADGAVAAGNDLIYWGKHGLSFWSRETRHETPASACIRISDHLAALTDHGLEILNAA